MKLGKQPATQDHRDYKATQLLDAAQATSEPPARFGHGTILRDWGMLGNDKAGDCVPAGGAHEHELFTRIGAGPKALFDEHGVLSDYSAITGYDPTDPNTDSGTNVRDALSYRVKTGLVDSGGKRHKIAAYAALPVGDWYALMRATFYFGAVGIGVEFPQSAMDQFNAGEPWDVVPGSPIEGGHYIPVVGRSSLSVAGVISWGRRVGMTRAFYEAYCDEAWLFVTEDDLKKSGKNERGLDFAGLQALLNSLR